MSCNHVNHGTDNKEFPDASFFRSWSRCFFDNPIFTIFGHIGNYHCTADSKSQACHDRNGQNEKPGEPIGVKILNPKRDEEKPGGDTNRFFHRVVHFEIYSSGLDEVIIGIFAAKSKR